MGLVAAQDPDCFVACHTTKIASIPLRGNFGCTTAGLVGEAAFLCSENHAPYAFKPNPAVLNSKTATGICRRRFLFVWFISVYEHSGPAPGTPTPAPAPQPPGHG